MCCRSALLVLLCGLFTTAWTGDRREQESVRPAKNYPVRQQSAIAVFAGEPEAVVIKRQHGERGLAKL